MLGCHSRTSSIDSSTSLETHEQLLVDLQDIRLAVIKISNISWGLTSADVVDFLEGVPVDKRHIHVPIDRQTGKTKADMFVELASMTEAIKCLARYNKRILRGRVVGITLASLEELSAAHFPTDNKGEFLSQAEACSLVNTCRNYKVCATAPFIICSFLIRHTFLVNALSDPLNTSLASYDWLLGIRWNTL